MTPGSPEADAIWFLALGGAGIRAEWPWDDLGAPEIEDLHPVRRPTSGDFSRHIPVTAYSVTTSSFHELESGLEHDLVRWLDRRSDVTWLLAQPVMLHFPGARRASHIPDLLSRQRDGSVTVWDARPSERRDDLFEHRATLAAQACLAVGWRYQVFSGLTSTAERMNLLWLGGFRLTRPWTAEARAALRGLIESEEVGSIGDVAHFPDSSELLSTLWHLIWTGEVYCDLTQKLTAQTPLAWAEDGRG